MARIFSWSKTADFEEGDETDFDSEVDNDGDLNAATAAAHDGAYGIEITFDNDTAAYGVLNASAVNQTTGSISFWVDPNTVTLDNGKVINLIHIVDGAGAANWYIQLYNNAGTYQIYVAYVDDADAYQTSGTKYNISDAYTKIIFAYAVSSTAGADDGWSNLYIGNVLRENSTGHDNDTQDWDAANFGMCWTNSTGFGSSFYMDTLKVSSSLYFLEGFTARYRDYNFNAPQHFTISSNKVQMTARYRDYNFNAPEREGYG